MSDTGSPEPLVYIMRLHMIFRYKIMDVKQTNGHGDSTVQNGHGDRTVQNGHGDSVVKNGCNGHSSNKR